MLEEGFFPLSPIAFFQIQWDCLYVPPKGSIKEPKYRLPDTSEVCHEDHFADLYMGWNEEGICFACESMSPFKDAFYPDVSRGDSLELFIDTRDVKTSGYNTKFCHHFFFLPQAVDGQKAGEITRFRSEDAHDLCDPKELHLQAETKDYGYKLNLFIPSTCLHGYDPKQFDRMGFTYRVNRYGRSPQHFSAITSEFAIEQQPALWSSIKFVS